MAVDQLLHPVGHQTLSLTIATNLNTPDAVLNSLVTGPCPPAKTYNYAAPIRCTDWSPHPHVETDMSISDHFELPLGNHPTSGALPDINNQDAILPQFRPTNKSTTETTPRTFSNPTPSRLGLTSR